MRFAALVSSLVAINAANASPTAPIPANTRDISTKYAVDVESAECNGGKCVEVIAAAGCVLLAIAGRNVPALLACVGGATDKLCGCAGCIDPLGDFLEENKIC